MTFYADCDLPAGGPREKSAGFDWHRAIAELTRTARAHAGLETLIVTDWRTKLPSQFIRIGDARFSGIMLWLLDAQAAAIRVSSTPFVMVSPDTLIAGPLDTLFGDWDVCLLTRSRPKPIVNSVIAVRPGQAVAALWASMARAARELPETSRTWGADIDALVETMGIVPDEDGVREIAGVRVRLLPMDQVFRSASAPPRRLPVPIWDFKGARKRLMPAYAALL